MSRWIVSVGVAAAAALVIAFVLVGRGQGQPAYLPGGLFFGTGPPPSYSTATLSGVSAASPSAAWIVGSVAWRWNGRTWRAVPLPKLGDAVLQSVANVDAGDAWAVGYRGDGYLLRGRALVEHWDRTRWTVAKLPALGPSILFAVSSAGPRNVWAAGATFAPGRARPLLLRWDGTSWRRQPLPWAGRHVELDEVVATGPSSVWAVASGQQRYAGVKIAGSILVEHWDGVRWREVPPPFGPADFISGFGATSGSDAWAVGSYAQGGNSFARYSHALAAHWDGHTWQLLSVPNRRGATDSVLDDIVAVRPDDVWAAGASQQLAIAKGHGGASIRAAMPVGLFEHWDGRSWRMMPSSVSHLWDGEPAGLTVAADGVAWAIGSCRYDNLVTRWSGSAWELVAHPGDRHRYADSPPGPMRSCSSGAVGS